MTAKIKEPRSVEWNFFLCCIKDFFPCPSTIFMFFEHDQKIFRKLLIWSKAYSNIYTGIIERLREGKV